MDSTGRARVDGRPGLPRARVGLTALSAYAGCRQLHEAPSVDRPADRIEAIDNIRAYITRVEQALSSTEEGGDR